MRRGRVGSAPEVRAAKEKLAHRLALLLDALGVTPAEMARRMATSRAAVHRLLDESDTGVTLDTMVRAARALGVSLAELLGLAPMPSARRLRALAGTPAAPTARPKQESARGTTVATAAHQASPGKRSAPKRRAAARPPER